MKKLLPCLILLTGVTVTFGQTVSTDSAAWSWTPPKTFTNGTAIPSTDPITYNVYVGIKGPGSEVSTPVEKNISATTVTTNGYAAGELVCGQVTAVVGGLESAHSVEACKSFPATSAAPTGLSVQ